MTTQNHYPAVRRQAAEYLAGHLSRREVLSRPTLLGASSAAAYGLIGLAMPSPARAAARWWSSTTTRFS